jgi:hypothetical protein
MDIVDELRELANEFASVGHDVDMLREAADEIEQLRQDARDFAEQLTEDPEIIDFACAECLPDYTDVLPGFRCARHRAQSWLSAHPAESKE